MSDLLLNSQQLTQALAQLNKVSSSNALAQQGATVIVKHIAGNHLLLSDQKQSKSIELPKTNIQGNLISGKEYGLKIVHSTNNHSLLFLSTAQDNGLQLTKLTAQALAAIVEDPKTQIRATLAQQAQNVQAIIKGISPNGLTVGLPGTGQTVTLNLPQQARSQGFSAGQPVQIRLTPVGNHWQASLIAPGNIKVRLELDQNQLAPKDPQVKPVNTLLTESLAQMSKNQPKELAIPTQSLLSLAKSNPGLFSSDLTSVLSQLNSPQLLLKIDSKGTANLLIALGEVLAKVPLQKNHVESLRNFVAAQLQQSAPHSSSRADSSIKGSESSGQAIDKTIINTGQAGPVHTKSAIFDSKGKSEIADKAQLTALVDLLRKSHSVSANPSEVLKQIESFLKVNSDGLSSPTKALLDSIVSQINRSIPQGSAADPENIRHMFMSPPLSLSATNLTSPTNQQGLLAGLMTLLQITLGARVGQERPQLMERVTQLIKNITALTSTASPTVNQRTIQDINQLDQRGLMIRELTRLLANHQTNKLANAEQALLGQDSFYYVLPSSFGNNKKDVELLIKRELEENQNSKNKHEKTSTWHLTMKLSVGEAGELLGKAKLKENQLDLDIYTSNDELKTRVLEYLPLLKQRFVELGIEVNKTQCQLGKIPMTLNNRPYHIFETQA